jgi:hypothetical protein
MKVFAITDTITVLRGEKNAEPKYRKAVSARIIEKFGKEPYSSDVQKQLFFFCQGYFIEEFEKVCEKETSYTFYREIFILHEQATDLRRSDHYHQLPLGINKHYVSVYRRVLKMVLEKGCDVDMKRGEKRDLAFILRIQPVLNDLLYLGEMIFDFTESIAEISMVEGICEITFDENELYKQVRQPHFDLVFHYISKELETSHQEYIIDPTGSADFNAAIQAAFGMDYDKLGLLLALLYEKFKLEPPYCLCSDTGNFTTDAASVSGTSRESAARFLSGLTLNRGNKMPLAELVRRPYLMNRFLYRPLLEWTIDSQPYFICGIYSVDEAKNTLVLNAIPWGKFPKEWEDAPGFTDYVNCKKEQHDQWLDDEVEKIITNCGLCYDRGVKKIHTKGKSYSLTGNKLGEIDFLVISPQTKKLYVTECKHLLGRYDMVNWKQDHDHFTVDGSKSAYNTRIAAKVEWITTHLIQVEEHFRRKYQDKSINLDGYAVEGVFVINTPTFYMYNALYRIYPYHQFGSVINGQYTDPVYTMVAEGEDSVTTYFVKYPYFARRELRYFDLEEDAEVDKYGYPVRKPV